MPRSASKCLVQKYKNLELLDTQAFLCAFPCRSLKYSHGTQHTTLLSLHNIRMNWTLLTLSWLFREDTSTHSMYFSDLDVFTWYKTVGENDQRRLHSSRPGLLGLVFQWGFIPSTSATLPLVWRGNPKDIVAIQSASPCPKKCPPNFSHASENPPGGAPEKSDKNLITLSQIIFSDWLHISIINSVTELAKWKGGKR